MDRYYEANEKVSGYSVLKLLGEGRYGIVYLAENDKKQKCIIKQLKNEMLVEAKEKLIYEEQTLQKLKDVDNQKFPKFLSKFKDEHSEGYLMEYIEGRVFEDILAKERYKFAKEEIYKIGSKILELVEILHSYNIVHRDIRLPNVILKENNQLALIDFGLARFINNKRYVRQSDYWYISDFLIHLYYTTFEVAEENLPERPWFEELDLTAQEKIFLKKLMGIEGNFDNIKEIKEQLEKIKNAI